MPLVKVLGEMQFNGMYVDKEELIEFGDNLKENIETIKKKFMSYAEKNLILIQLNN